MTDQVAPVHSSSHASVQTARVGTPAELAAARESRGMSQLDISHRLKLQVRQVNALEEGQWEALPGKSFVRGALRSYGRLLGVDVAPLLESIGGFAEPAPVHALQQLDASLSRSSGLGFNGGGQGRPILWVVACLLAIVALVLYFGSEEDTERVRSWLPSAEAPGTPVAPVPSGIGGIGPDPSSQPPPADPLSPAPVSALPAPPAQAPAAVPGGQLPGASPPPGPAAVSGSGAAAPGPAVTGPGAGAAGQSAAAGSAAAGQITPPGAPGPGGGTSNSGAGPAATAAGGASGLAAAGTAAAETRGVLRLQAVEDSWVEVRQADSSKLHNAVIRAGSSVELKGNPPYRLIIGNATGLRLSYEGRAHDLAPHIGAHNIAKLQLD